MRSILLSLSIIASLIATGVILIAATIPAALWPATTVAGFLVGFVLIGLAGMESLMLWERLAGTFTRFAGYLKRKGVTE